MKRESVKIGCISDTHIPTRASRIPEKVYEIFNLEKVKIIFFAGDLVTLKVIYDLESYINPEKIIAVQGNMDRYEVKQKYPEIVDFEILGHKIKMIHKLKDSLFKESGIKLIIFGHTHKDKIDKKGDILLLNPGSGTGSGLFTARSLGLINITEENILPTIAKF